MITTYFKGKEERATAILHGCDDIWGRDAHGGAAHLHSTNKVDQNDDGSIGTMGLGKVSIAGLAHLCRTKVANRTLYRLPLPGNFGEYRNRNTQMN